MKLTIFGATGNSGLQLVKQALERGHEVTAVVRNPDKLDSFKSNPNFKIVTANILEASELVPILTGQDCVLSGLGVPSVQISAISLYSNSIKAICTAMNQANVKRLICMTSFYSKPYGSSYPYVYTFLLRPMIGRQLDDMYRMEEYLMNESKDIDYTIVRPPRLTDEPLQDPSKLITNEDGYNFPNVKSKNSTPRANVAHFMLDQIDSNKHIKKGVAIDFP